MLALMTNTLIPATAIATRALDGQGQRHTAFTASLYILKTPSGGGCCRASLSSALLTPLVPSRSHPPPTSSDKLKRLVTSSDLSKMDGIFFFFPESLISVSFWKRILEDLLYFFELLLRIRPIWGRRSWVTAHLWVSVCCCLGFKLCSTLWPHGL